MAGKPAAYTGTVNNQYQGDQSNRVSSSSGTPYNSVNGNPANARIVKQNGGIAMVGSGGGNIVHNDPGANGNGVVFDVNAATGQDKLPALLPTLDSPVPVGAQMPQLDSVKKLNELRNGDGAYWGVNDVIADNIQAVGGVMSRDITEN